MTRSQGTDPHDPSRPHLCALDVVQGLVARAGTVIRLTRLDLHVVDVGVVDVQQLVNTGTRTRTPHWDIAPPDTGNTTTVPAVQATDATTTVAAVVAADVITSVFVSFVQMMGPADT